MRRGLRVSLALTATAGALVLSAGTAFAGNDPDGGSGDDNDGHHDHSAGFCTHDVDHDKPLEEADYPSDNADWGYKNTTSKEVRDSHGAPYYLHNKICKEPRPWRGWDWHDDSYKTFKYKVRDGEPVYNQKQNTYYSIDGYTHKGDDYDKKKLEHKGPTVPESSTATH